PDEAYNVARRAVGALAYLHAGGIVHGNLHPGSLLFGPDSTIVLGLPCSMNRRLAIDPAMEGDSDMAHFMAPECAAGTRATVASDVWSMAAMLYFMLTLEVPRERYTDQSEQDAVCQN